MQISCRNALASDGGAGDWWGLSIEALEDGVTVNMAEVGTTSSLPAITLESSLDARRWTSFDPAGTTPITLSHAGDRVCFRAGSSGNTGLNASDTTYRHFTATGSHAAHGSVMSILDPAEPTYTFQSIETWGQNLCKLFCDDTGLLLPPELPATTLSQSCYQYMFLGCSSLIEAPELPAETLTTNCYYGMFEYCASLAAMPTIAATTLANSCCRRMFQHCAALTEVSISAAPCESASYHSVFQYCSGLKKATVNTTSLAAGCLLNAFRSTAITDLTVAFSAWNGTATNNWLTLAPASGVFHCPRALDTSVRSTARIPSGWTIEYID